MTELDVLIKPEFKSLPSESRISHLNHYAILFWSLKKKKKKKLKPLKKLWGKAKWMIKILIREADQGIFTFKQDEMEKAVYLNNSNNATLWTFSIFKTFFCPLFYSHKKSCYILIC